MLTLHITQLSKPDGEHLSASLHARVHPLEKSAWVKKAKPRKLAEWVRDTLNQAAGFDLEEALKKSQPKRPK